MKKLLAVLGSILFSVGAASASNIADDFYAHYSPTSDLSAYNTELVARAAFDCPKFLVSAVGHETDYTIIDFVSDFRAPTPSAAAEILTKDLNQTKFNFNIVINNLIKAYSNFIKNKKNILRTNSSKLLTLTDKNILTAQAKLINNSNLFVNTFERFLNCKYYDLGLNEVKLNKNNPVEILNRGFAKIEQNKESIKSIKNIDFNKELSIIFKDGNITAKPIKKEK